MLRKRRHTKVVKTVFRTYFRKHHFNRMIRNLYVELGDIPSLMGRARMKWESMYSFLLPFLKNTGAGHKKVAIVDLSILRDMLAVKLKEPWRKTITLSDHTKFEFEQIQLKDILAQQAQLLQALLDEQRRVLREQAEKIIQEEKERIRENLKSQNSHE